MKGVQKMSRSYKKNPYATDHKCGTTKDNKSIANRRVRRMVVRMGENMPARLQHRKMTETYDVHDWKERWTKEDAIDFYLNGPHNEFVRNKYPTLKAYLKFWEKCSRRK